MKKPNLLLRFAAFYIDLMVASIIASPLLYLYPPKMNGALFIFQAPYFYAGFFLILIKDISGRSIGKRLLKLHLVSQDKKFVPICNRILRNLTCCIWPIEALVALISEDGTRLGDKVFKTKVVTSKR